MNLYTNHNTTNKLLLLWIALLTLMVFLIIIIGGITRLTDSGLSMTEWRPIMGIIPPFSYDQWLIVFQKYKLTPEFKIVNSSISLDEFKFIFWWEWFHRFFARVIGVIFIIPFVYFYFKKKLSIHIIKILFLIFVLGLIQAIVGWWMVKSGLVDNPYVSAYRLTFHLANALLIFILLFWLSLNTYFGKEKKSNIIQLHKKFFHIALSLIFLTIITGAFMAGTDAGKSYNTFPLMGGKIIPEGYYLNEYGWKNFFENTIAINFNHRWLGMITFLFVFIFIIYLIKSKKSEYNKISLYLVLFLIFLQIFLGIITLTYVVPISFASLHQTNSVLLLGATLFSYHRMIYK